MKEKDIKRIIRKQVKSNHPDWQRIPRKRKKLTVTDLGEDNPSNEISNSWFVSEKLQQVS